MKDLFEIEPMGRGSVCDPNQLFEDFWAAYPRKVGKGGARKAYMKARKMATDREIAEGLIAQLPMLEEKDRQFIPHASTWLNQERWTDEPEHVSTNSQIRPDQDPTLRAIFNAATARPA